MRNWLVQSEAAKEQGVCHTEEECVEMYADIPSKKRDEAVEFLAERLMEVLPFVKEEIKPDPKNWNVPHHLWWGMGVRNLLRDNGFDEPFFGVDNLDCIYKFLVEAACSSTTASTAG